MIVERRRNAQDRVVLEFVDDIHPAVGPERRGAVELVLSEVAEIITDLVCRLRRYVNAQHLVCILVSVRGP